MLDERPAAYFSHSYDVLDRRVTDFFLEVLSERFALAVDPRSATLSTMHLELMMRRTACFVAVVTRRENQPQYRCSPFAVHEYGMAVLANRPRLVIPEINIPARHFIGADLARPFNRNRLAAYRMPLDALDELVARAREHTDEVDRPLGAAALVLPPTPEYAAAEPELRRLISQAGWQVDEISAALLRDEVDAAGAATLLDRYDFVLLDVLDPRTPSWVLPFLQARGVPTVRLVCHRADDPIRQLPRLAVSHALQASSAVNRHAIWWSEMDVLLPELGREIGRLQMPRLPFAGLPEARRYVWSLGRDQGPVFLSSAQGDNDFAQLIAQELDLRNVEHFHYLFNSDLPRGKAWEHRLLAKVGECRIFVPLVSRHYLDSAWCRKEMEIALELSGRGRMRILPYFLDHHAGASVPVQGASVVHLDAAARVRRVVDDVDRALTDLTDRRHRPRIGIAVAGGRTALDVDVVVLATGPTEYAAAARTLRHPAPVVGTAEHPNHFDWLGGTVARPQGSGYQLVLCRAGTDGGREALRAAVEAFGPEHVVLLGTASAVVPADVVVADRICGFHRLSIDSSFVPSLHRDYPTDPGVAASAEGLPSVVRGTLAVGDEVVPAPDASSFAPVLDTWPDTVAVGVLSVDTVEQLEDFRSYGRISHFSAVVGVAPPDADDAARAVAAERAFTTVSRLVSAHWPRPPRTDAADEGASGVASAAD
ncbi:toll/interleukin-1 receptor domain-containing protein [Micromonospora sp. WMMD987]|uniref:toll/interleukin-1 receptor domain-containing protein n=1 Tax=Micromonospora sp. WMMD987 TaxID=3016089 RepID=UPI00249A7605|nr:toll/interleukin-1 receptor domain-containing protein [Micromonospora sp. WMMD987]WFE96125.1 toll/interleukin-1 receptor domain-containing protein [Micromonospora sp. WMMD987]